MFKKKFFLNKRYASLYQPTFTMSSSCCASDKGPSLGSSSLQVSTLIIIIIIIIIIICPLVATCIQSGTGLAMSQWSFSHSPPHPSSSPFLLSFYLSSYPHLPCGMLQCSSFPTQRCLGPTPPSSSSEPVRALTLGSSHLKYLRWILILEWN